MAQEGRLIHWNDERGFGFIAADDGERVFVHVSELRAAWNRPLEGDTIRFVRGFGTDGRIEAKSAQILGGARVSTPKRRAAAAAGSSALADWRLPAALVIACLVVANVLLGRLPQMLAILYAVMGVVSLIAYGSDKRFAATGQWRTSETTLLGFDLFFGLIGGLLGQALFRHKTRKQSFITATLLIVLTHLLWLAAFASGLIDTQTLWSEFSSLLQGAR